MKSKNIYELDPERLATTDEHGNRVYLYPEDVKGFWKTRRTYFYWALIILYLVAPWFYINGKPMLMIDIMNREFTVVGFTLHGVEPILFFLIAASGIFLIAAITSSLGRVWCGWACPQTVFIQSIFMKIESLVEGKARQRRALDQGPMTFNKVARKVIKWSIFTVIALHIAHTFVGYFVGPKELLHISMNSPGENLGLFTLTMTASLIILLDFGWFREQFCIIACPYGRMQSVMMDENSLVVAYDVKRGEPRRNVGIPSEAEGDCINCYNCVKVCPTGIDIRRGTQLECIACTQCVDACDSIMTKLDRPKGLIRYSSENEMLGKGKKRVTKRSILYVAISLVFIVSFAFFLRSSTHLDLVFLRSRTPFQVVDSGRLILNQFNLKIRHQGDQKFSILLNIKEPDLQKSIQVITPTHPISIHTPEQKFVVFFKFPPELLLSGTRKVNVEVYDVLTKEVVVTKEVVLVGPLQ